MTTIDAAAEAPGVDPALRTPWGRAGELAAGRLRPGPGSPPEQVRRSQRERLFGAMVAVASSKGYGETTVAELTGLAGVSRTTFYELFEGKLDCLLATLRQLVGAAIAATAAEVREEAPVEERARRGLSGFVELLLAQPAAARLCLVESYAAGPEAVRLMDEALAAFERLIGEVLARGPGREGMPPATTAAMAGAMRKLLHRHLHRGTEAELVRMAPALVELGLAYGTPPRPLSGRQRWGGGGPAERRAARQPAARIERSTLAVVAANGFARTTITEIVAGAGVSPTTFYEHFEDKEEALGSALFSFRMRLAAEALPAFRRARDWPRGMRGAIEAALCFFADEPDFARVATVEAYGAGARVLESVERGIEATGAFLDGGFELAPQAPPIAREALPCTLFSLVCDEVRARDLAGLPRLAPLATYLVLAPFLGAEEACAIANDEGRGG